MSDDGLVPDTAPIEPLPAAAPAVRRGRALGRLALPVAAVLVLALLVARSVALPPADPGPLAPSPAAPAASTPIAFGPPVVAAAVVVDPGPVLGLADAPLPLSREVFGFLPYWKMDAKSIAGLRYDLLSTIAIFGVGITRSGALDTTTNGYRAFTGPTAAKVTAAAHARKARVVPTFQLFDKPGAVTMTRFLGDPKAQKTFIAQAVALIKARGADGAVLDFEPLPERLSAPFAAFASDFRHAIRAKDATARLTVTLHQAASDAQIAAIAGSVDRIFVMAYDYHWLGSHVAGPVAPLDGPGGDVRLTLLRFIEGAGARKVILGVPYFGYDWPIAFKGPGADVRLPASKNGGVWSLAYSAAVDFLKKHPSVKVQWDPTAASPYVTYHDTKHRTDRQAWYENERSIAAKYALAKAAGVAGVGIWALGMDTGRSELWNLIRTTFGKK
jgi:spore germination protein YaaH